MGSTAHWPNTAQHPLQEAAMVQALPTRRQFIAGLASLPAWGLILEAHAAPALLRAQTAPAGIDPMGYLISEKYDGVRALWDGRLLRFRSGLAIAAPAAFVERLPAVPLDGQLWLARGRFEVLSGLVRRQSPDAAAWRQLRYMVFELPGASGSFASRAQRIEGLVQHTPAGRNCRP
jgi:DNA ligase-1